MKKVIVIYSSPEEQSNSATMADHFIKGIKQNKDIEVCKVYLKDTDFEMYCHAKKVPLECESDFLCLTEKIQKAQGLVIATPTYNFGVPAKLKNFVDRIGFIALDYKQKNWMGQPVPKLGYLKTFFLVSGGTPTIMQKLLFFLFPPFWLWVVFKYYGAKQGGSVFGGNLTYQNPARKQPVLLQHCEKKGQIFANSL